MKNKTFMNVVLPSVIGTTLGVAAAAFCIVALKKPDAEKLDRWAREQYQAMQQSSVCVSGNNSGPAAWDLVYDDIPENVVQLLSEATRDEAAAAVEMQETYLQGFLCVSGRNAGPGIQTYCRYGDDAVEAIKGLACAIYTGAGGCGEETMRMFGDVVLNRVNDNRFPSNIIEVLNQDGQFGTSWPTRVANRSEYDSVELAYKVAVEVFDGKHSDIYGDGYIWCSRESQGHTQIWKDRLCFGK